MAGEDPEVVAILDSVGLAGLAPHFAAEEIDGPTLWSLRAEELRELGLADAEGAALLARLRPEGTAPEDRVVPPAAALAAAEQALQRSALAEAAAFLAQAERGLAGVRDEQADPLRLRLLIARSSIARTQLGIASDEAGRLGREVLALARKLRETRSELMR